MDTPRRSRLPTRDRVTIGLLLFFIAVACTMELYYVVYADQLVARAKTDWIAYLFSLYGVADRTYFDAVSPLSLALETFNVFFTQPLDIWLIWAIYRRKRYRHVLQLIISSYLTYSVVLYFWQAQLSGFADMGEHSFYAFFMFYAPNLPWLLGYGYLAYDAARELTRALAPAARDSGVGETTHRTERLHGARGRRLTS